MGKVIAVCISEKKGTQKHPVQAAEFIEDWGIKDDAHAGKWHRQVSLLSYDKIVVLEMTQIGKECHHGCALFQKMGDCIMPREGVFTKVLHGGIIREGDEFVIEEKKD